MSEVQKNDQIISLLEGMSALELKKLSDALCELWGVSADMPVMAAGAPVGEAVEEKTEFDVILEKAGDSTLGVIKEVRAITSLGLKEAKDLVSGAMPQVVKAGISKAEAEEIKKKLEAAGASIKIA